MPRRNNTPKPIKKPIQTRSCHSKRAFRNEREASDAAEKQMLLSPQVELDVYRCDQCRYWHLTSIK